MAEIINLNRARKARARAADQKQAADNRVKFGRSKSEKQAAKAEQDRIRRNHAATLLEGRDRKDPE